MKKFSRINLSGNEQYLEVLRALEDRTEYIEIRHNNGEVSETFSDYLEENKDKPECIRTLKRLKEIKNNLNAEVLDFAFENLQLIKRDYDDNTYIFKSNKIYFEFLRKFESFYINKVSKSTFTTLTTDFGTDDISFLDERNKRLFSSTTHEGYGLASGELDLDMNIMEEFGD